MENKERIQGSGNVEQKLAFASRSEEVWSISKSLHLTISERSLMKN